MKLCRPWFVTHSWTKWAGLEIPGQPDARPYHMVRQCTVCGWEQRATVKE